MTTAAKIATQLVKIEDAIKVAEGRTQAKIDALVASCTLHRLFVIASPQHPYYAWHTDALSLQQLLKDFAESISTLTINNRTVHDELRTKATGLQVSDTTRLDLDDVAAKASNLYRVAAHVWSCADQKITKQEISKNFAAVRNNIEVPFLSIRKECGAVVREMKKLAKELLDEKIGGKTLRESMEKTLTMQIMLNQPQDAAMTYLYKLPA